MSVSKLLVDQIQHVLKMSGNTYKRCQLWIRHRVDHPVHGDFLYWALCMDARTPKELAIMLHVAPDGYRECTDYAVNGLIIVGDKSARLETALEPLAAPVGHCVGIMEDGDSARITEYCGRCLLRTEIVPTEGEFSWASVMERTVDPSALLSWRPSALSQCAAHLSALRQFSMTVRAANAS